MKVDWLKPVLPVFQHVIDAAQQEEWLGHKVRIATAESLIVTKLVAFRRQDQLDIENLLAANQGQLDLDLVRCEMKSIAELDDPRLVQFEEMVNQFYSESLARISHGPEYLMQQNWVRSEWHFRFRSKDLRRREISNARRPVAARGGDFVFGVAACPSDIFVSHPDVLTALVLQTEPVRSIFSVDLQIL